MNQYRYKTYQATNAVWYTHLEKRINAPSRSIRILQEVTYNWIPLEIFVGNIKREAERKCFKYVEELKKLEEQRRKDKEEKEKAKWIIL